MRDAARAIADIEARGRVPLLVGGTMLYLRALIGGIATLPQGSDADPRRASMPTPHAIGWPALHARLAAVDAVAAARIHPNDAQRIQRALEVFTRRPASRSRSCRRATRSPLAREFVVRRADPAGPRAAARGARAALRSDDGRGAARRGARGCTRAAI